MMMMKKCYLQAMLLLASLALTISAAQQTELDEARYWWANSTTLSAPSNYTFEYRITQDGVQENSRFIDVREDLVTAVNQEYLMMDNDPDVPADFPNVEGLFDMIQDAIDSNATTLTVEYDEQYGYPVEISIQQDASSSDLTIQVPSMTLYTVLQRDLNLYMDTFQRLALTDYDYVIQVWCFCQQDYVRPKRIEVRDNAITSVVDQETGAISEIITGYPTVRESFDRIQRSITNFHVSIIVEYDWTYGYPKSMAFDMERNMADDEISFDFLDFIPRRFTPEQDALDSAMALWEFRALDRYSFGYQQSCFCEPDFQAALLVQVENAEVIGMTTREGETVLPEVAEDVPSIEDIFDMIQEAINLDAARIVVVYDVDGGYPTSVNVDYDEEIADEELSIVVDYLGPVGEWKSDLDQGQSTWEAIGVVTYTYVYQRSSQSEDSSLPMTVEVVDNMVVNVIPSISGEPEEATERQGSDDTIPTIDGLFEEIQDAIDSNAFRVVVQYDEQLGYPTSIFIDYDEFLADEELSISATLQRENLNIDPTKVEPDEPTQAPVGVRDETDAPISSPSSDEESGAYYGGGRGLGVWGWLSPMILLFCSRGIAW